MSQPPSQTVTDLLTGIEDGTVHTSDLIHHIKAMRDQFLKEEAEAYRSLQVFLEYHKVEAG